ncbi:piggyBac transposable element-derived protein 3-like isoform X1 [Bactrocera dorsalis]|uniref:PiggyBac transposable element-derived protein 3-like isoform X1 n=1 Tax=Bactrocera dorsalis TaxID=27457 RepID=A0ABM3JDN6_BACDO|nr:piggyBac transposable element-derived protein 3-like isoform X1 [Bactrocera dorsalis]
MYVMSTRGQEVRYQQADFKRFYGCAMIMGCLGFPKIRMYWSHEFQIPAIYNSMSRDKFLQMRSDIHFADVSVPDPCNKLWRVQPVIDLVRNRCNNLATEITQHLIDEQVVPFTGRCPARQTIRSKPRPTGLKNLVCATVSGMIVDIEVFQGAGTFQDCGLGHGASIIMRLTKHLPKGSHIYFDRFFTTIPLIQSVHQIGFHGTGIIMANRLDKNLKFPQDKEMNRGDIIQFTNGDNVAVVKWKDSKGVVVVSSQCGKDPIGETDRWNKNMKRRCPVHIAKVIENYNELMGGVDIADQMLEYYRIKMKTRKWTVKVFFHFLDLAVFNSWMESKRDAKLAGLHRSKVKTFLTFEMKI